MLKGSDTNLDDVSSVILNAGFDVAFIVPTETAMNKSIMDAHESLRAFFVRNNIHDFSEQEQGKESKRLIGAHYITDTIVTDEKVSLYRPETKGGDPRVWIYNLKALAKPYNLLAFIYSEGELYIVNCSHKLDLEHALSTVIPKPIQSLSESASELLGKLQLISAKGFVPSHGKGDMGVGKTLESLLGISANSNKAPDYKGIELKATRIEKGRTQKNKNQLFSKTPAWKLSPVGKAEDLVVLRGYEDSDGLKALRHTISGSKPNSLGLYLDVDYINKYLRQMFTDLSVDDFHPVHDMTWLISDLKKALYKKHNETFWVKAQHNNDRDNEEFHYIEVEHTVKPYVDRLETLLETGLVTMDYTLHLKESGKARDHGYLFKIRASSMEALFPKPSRYDLTEGVPI